MNRKLTKDKIAEKLKIVRDFLKGDALIMANYILGVPAETIKEIEETIQLAADLGFLTDWASFYCYMPLPSTELYRRAVEERCIDPDRIDFSHLNAQESIMQLPGLNPKEITFILTLANYKILFFLNKHIQDNPPKAIESFQYALSICPEHCFAF